MRSVRTYFEWPVFRNHVHSSSTPFTVAGYASSRCPRRRPHPSPTTNCWPPSLVSRIMPANRPWPRVSQLAASLSHGACQVMGFSSVGLASSRLLMGPPIRPNAIAIKLRWASELLRCPASQIVHQSARSRRRSRAFALARWMSRSASTQDVRARQFRSDADLDPSSVLPSGSPRPPCIGRHAVGVGEHHVELEMMSRVSFRRMCHSFNATGPAWSRSAPQARYRSVRAPAIMPSA